MGHKFVRGPKSSVVGNQSNCIIARETVLDGPERDGRCERSMYREFDLRFNLLLQLTFLLLSLHLRRPSIAPVTLQYIILLLRIHVLRDFYALFDFMLRQYQQKVSRRTESP